MSKAVQGIAGGFRCAIAFSKFVLVGPDEGGSGALTVRDRHFDEALTELILHGGELTKKLLGFGGAERTSV